MTNFLFARTNESAEKTKTKIGEQKITTKIAGLLNLSRILITIATLVYGFVPLLVDLTETHVFHPDWTPHARFHMVWLLATNTSLALVSLYLLWISRFDTLTRLQAADVICLCALGGFFISLITKNLYCGSLADPHGGVPPIMGLDANLVVFTPMLLLVVIGLFLCFRSNENRY